MDAKTYVTFTRQNSPLRSRTPSSLVFLDSPSFGTLIHPRHRLLPRVVVSLTTPNSFNGSMNFVKNTLLIFSFLFSYCRRNGCFDRVLLRGPGGSRVDGCGGVGMGSLQFLSVMRSSMGSTRLDASLRLFAIKFNSREEIMSGDALTIHQRLKFRIRPSI